MSARTKRFASSKASSGFSNGQASGSVWTSAPTERTIPFENAYKLRHVIGKGHFGNVFECEPLNDTTTTTITITAISIPDPLVRQGFRQNNAGVKSSEHILKPASQANYAAKVIKKKRAKRSPLGCDLDDIKREYVILMLCNHENICRLHGAYEDETNVMFVLDLASGGEFFHNLALRDSLTEQHLTSVFLRQILEALSYLHARSIVHLDLKPENILIKRPGSEQVMLIDFGLSRVVNAPQESADSESSDTAIRCIQGTPEFCAPEVLAYNALSTQTDMWSFGVVCYMIICQKSPFLGESQQETFVRIEKAQYEFPTSGNCSPGAREFVSALLRKVPQTRLTAGEAKQYEWVAAQTDSQESKVDLQRFRQFYVERKRAQLEDVDPEIAKKLLT